MSIEIRSYQLPDCQAISDIYNEVVLQGDITMDCEPYVAQKIEDLVNYFNSREIILIAHINRTVVGWSILKSTAIALAIVFVAKLQSRKAFF